MKMPIRYRDSSKIEPRIRDTSTVEPRISPEEVAKALGAEIVAGPMAKGLSPAQRFANRREIYHLVVSHLPELDAETIEVDRSVYKPEYVAEVIRGAKALAANTTVDPERLANFIFSVHDRYRETKAA